MKLKTYSGEQLTVKGVIKVEVKYADQQAQLRLVVVARGNGLSLLVRGWLMKILMDWTHDCVLTMYVILSPCRVYQMSNPQFFTRVENTKGYLSDNFLGPYSRASVLQVLNSALFGTKREN